MRGITLLAVLIVTFLCPFQGASALDSLEVSASRSGLIVALQSAAVPGLGQMSGGEWLRGGLFLAGEAFLAGDALYYWEGQYDKPGWDQAGRLFNRDLAYSLAVWYSLGAVFSAADAYYAVSKKRTSSPTLAALQSVVFPGWGQLANGQRWKAAGMFLLQTGLAFAAYYQHESFLFHDGLGQEQEARFYKDDRNRLIWWSVGAVIFSAADAFVDCHLKDWDVSENLSLGLTYFQEQKVLGLRLRLPLSSFD